MKTLGAGSQYKVKNKNENLPASGNEPIDVSGKANKVLSVATVYRP
jgi:hypothetical protein